METLIVDVPPLPKTIPPREKRRRAWTGPALVAGIALVAAAMRLYHISAKTFWFDETVSVEIARLPWPQFVLALWNREANMAFYYVLLHFWLRIGGTEGFIRDLSVVFSVATIPVVYALGSRLFSRNTGLAAAWLLCINAYHICYAQAARGYALEVFLVSLATLLLVKNLQEPASAHWGAYTAVSVLAVYSHFFAGLLILAHFVSLLLLKRAEVPWREFLRSVIRFSFLMIPIAIVVMRVGTGPINWIQKTRPDSVLNFLTNIAGNGGIRLIAIDAVAIALSGFWGAARWRAEGRTLKTWSFLLVWAWLLVPILIVLAASERQALFVSRYLMLCLPAFILLIAEGITRIRPVFLAWLLGIVISAASIAGTISYYHKDFDVGREDWRGATSFIFSQAQPGDGVFFYLNFGRIPFEFYRSIGNPLPEWPKSLDMTAELSNIDFKFRNLGESLANSRPAGNRVWVVLLYDTDPDGKPNRASTMCRFVFGKGRRLIDEKHFEKITVLLYSSDLRDVSRIPASSP